MEQYRQQIPVLYLKAKATLAVNTKKIISYGAISKSFLAPD
jgi:hypothetical protein